MPAPGSWVVAQCRNPLGQRLLPISCEEIDRLRHWLSWQLRPFAITPGSTVLQIMSTSTVWPMAALQQSLLENMLLPTFAESVAFDWYRVDAILRQFELGAVFNMNLETLGELERHSPASIDRLRQVPVVFADPPAQARLAELGIVAHAMLNLGATLAMECPQGVGLHVDGREWHIDEVDGEVHVTSLLPRLQVFDHERTGWRARVLPGACACGSPDWRILI